MNRLFHCVFLCIYFCNQGSGQELKQIIDYPDLLNSPAQDYFYISDSIIWTNNGSYLYFLDKNRRTSKPESGHGKILKSERLSKIYEINNFSFIVFDPATGIKSSSSFKYMHFELGYAEVFDDHYFIYHNKVDNLVYRVDFNTSGVITKYSKITLLQLGYDELITTVRKATDSIYYIHINNGLLLKKNIADDSIITLSAGVLSFVFDNNTLVMVKKGDLSISDNFGRSFKVNISLGNYPNFMYNSLNMNRDEFTFVYAKGFVATMYKDGQLRDIFDRRSVFSNLTTNYSAKTCDHRILISDRFHWIDRETWFLWSGDGDFYKYNYRKDLVYYLGGTFNLGVNKIYPCKRGKYFFNSTGNRLWAFSSDTGKTWKIPEMGMKNTVKNAEFIDSVIYILEAGNISKFQFGSNIFDESLHTKNFFIDNFNVKDENTLILFAYSGSYTLNLKTGKIDPLGPLTPHRDIAYLKKSKKFIFITNIYLFLSDNYGKSWYKADIKGYEEFNSVEAGQPIEFYENGSQVHVKVLFNETQALLQSLDSGRSFYVREDSGIRSALFYSPLHNDVYTFNSDKQLILADHNSENRIINDHWGDCDITGMQSFDSGIILWNSRAEIFRLDVPHKKVFHQQGSMVFFPNPVNSNSSLNLIFPLEATTKINSIEIYDMLGKKQGNVGFEFSIDQNTYRLNNLPSGSTQFYIILVKTTEGESFRQKVLIY